MAKVSLQLPEGYKGISQGPPSYGITAAEMIELYRVINLPIEVHPEKIDDEPEPPKKPTVRRRIILE